MTSVEDPYRTLGVEPGATAEEIQLAFRRVIRSLHPDHRGGAPADHLAITQLVEAWRLLGDPGRRADFDRTHRPPDPTLWQPPRPDPDGRAVFRTASFVRLFIVAAIGTGASLMVLFIIAMTQSG